MGRCAANLPASSMDAYLEYVLLSVVPAVLSSGPLDIDLREPVSSDGDTGGTSLVAACGAGGLLGGDELRGSRVMLPVNNSTPGRLLWLATLPEVFERSLVVRSKPDS